ncbi:MAG TPA: hypothetical protein VMB78_08360 [Dissulfurispiraceae bacterium]|nr:hypothetical protein [Dissulfurispiraceae bacterium]
MKIRLALMSVMVLLIASYGCVGYYDRDYDRGGYREYRDHDRDRDHEVHHDRDGNRDENRDFNRDRHDHGEGDMQTGVPH